MLRVIAVLADQKFVLASEGDGDEGQIGAVKFHAEQCPLMNWRQFTRTENYGFAVTKSFEPIPQYKAPSLLKATFVFPCYVTFLVKENAVMLCYEDKQG
jgi:hypothetical protein